ncbi:MAG: SelT/SelW/SelH family protein [Planctomycetota bacterium]
MTQTPTTTKQSPGTSGPTDSGPVSDRDHDPESRASAEPPPSVTIRYCIGCRWLLRAAYYAQELLTTFDSQLSGVTLEPDSSQPGGIFLIQLNGQDIWSRAVDGGFPETKELKRRVRDRITPGFDLGHSDRPTRQVVSEGHTCPLD